jgi:hypothetical protein
MGTSARQWRWLLQQIAAVVTMLNACVAVFFVPFITVIVNFHGTAW